MSLCCIPAKTHHVKHPQRLHPDTAKPSEPVRRDLPVGILGKAALLPPTVQYGIWGQMVGLSAGSIAG